MRTTHEGRVYLNDMKINLKLSAAWASFMFMYIYVDYFHLYMPNSINDIMRGKMYVFDITRTALLIGLTSVTIPALMIFFSLCTKPKVCRWINIVVAILYIPYTLFNLVGVAWAHMILGAAVELALLFMVLFYSIRWPRAGAHVSFS